MKSDSLEKFEPQREETNWTKILINFLLGCTVMAAVVYIFLTNYNKIGTLKQQQVTLEMEQELSYEMSSKLLPIHLFSTMNREQIVTRMMCTEDLNLDACIIYCETYQIYYPGIFVDKFECLQKHLKIPPSEWADIKCADYPFEDEYEKPQPGVK